MKRYRAVRRPGQISWMIEIERDGKLSGTLYKRCVCIRDVQGRHWPKRFKSKAAAHHHILDLFSETDKGEVGEWIP